MSNDDVINPSDRRGPIATDIDTTDAIEWRRWVMYRAPHIAYCALNRIGSECEIRIVVDGALMMSLRCSSMPEAMLYAATVAVDLEAEGWSPVEF